MSYIPKDKFTDQVRQDACNAINILIHKKQIPHWEYIEYSFEERGPRVHMMIWAKNPAQPDPNKEGFFLLAPKFFDPRDIIVSAGRLDVVRGTSDSI